MRRIFTGMLAACTAVAAMAAPPQRVEVDLDAERATRWVTFARTVDVEAAAAEALAAEASGAKPLVLLETNYYTFLPGERVQLRMSADANGFSAPVTLYLYWQDRNSGARRYYNIGAGSLLNAGQTADLFGSTAGPVPINVPELTDFVLFGSAADGTSLGWGINGALGASIAAPSPAQPGLYQYVLEVRDATGKRVISRSNANYSFISSSVAVSGQITSSQTWTADKRYVLTGFVVVKEPAVLTIEPGTVVYGGDTRATLFIARGAKLIADGTSRRPIVMTSAQKVGNRAQRDWGSLVVFGRAPINEPGGQAYLEGLPAQPEYQYGGTDPHDDSGVIRFVRLEFGGFEIEVNQEINGLTLGGVGDATVIDHLQVHMNKDDGVEFFGGTANAKHLLFTGLADDPIDGDLGWQGKVQFVVNIKSNLNAEGDSNILLEWDNHPQNYDYTPRTNPQVYNVTGVGTGTSVTGNYGGNLRRGTAGKVYNAITTQSRRAPITLRDTATLNQIPAGELIIDNSILYGSFEGSDAYPNSSDRPAETRTFLFTTMQNNRNVDPLLAIGTWSAKKFMMPDVQPLADSPALDVDYVKTPPDDGFFEAVDFIGGVGPCYNWPMTGWAIFSDN